MYASIAGIYNGLAKYDEALTAYQTALSISLKIDDKESLPRDYYNLGRFLELRGKKDEAKKAYEEVIRLTPNDGPNLLRRGAEGGLKRLRGESPPLKPSPTPKPSPSPGVSGFLWFGTLLRMLLV